MPLAGQVTKPQVRRGVLPSDCWEWLGPKTPAGYGKKQWHGRSIQARRWLWEQLHGPIEPGKVLADSCSNPGCVNPAHMRVVMQADANRAGTSAKLVSGDVIDIRGARGLQSAKELAAVYGVSPQTIRDVWRFSSWGKKRRNPRTIHKAANNNGDVHE